MCSLRIALVVSLSSTMTSQAGNPLVPAPSTEAAYSALANLVSNPSFEMDWMHNRVTVNTRFLLLEQSDWGYAQSDGRPDYWMVPDAARLDTRVAKFGKASLRLQGTASQVIYLLGETDPKDGGAHYNAFRPLPRPMVQHVKPRPLRFGAWCKTQDAKLPPSLTVVLEYGDGVTRTHTAAFAMGTHDWEYQEVAIPVRADLPAPHAAVLRLSFQGQGSAWFDGVLGEETLGGDEVNLLANGDFETLEKDWPVGWSAPVLWSWARREYYRFTGWSHQKGHLSEKTRNSKVAIRSCLVVPMGHNGGRSLQFTLLPGDNFAVKSAPIRLNQTAAHALEVSAWVKAEDLRWLEIMAQDENGQWLPQQDFSGCMGTDEHYRNRVAGIGSHDWEFVRKHFAPSRPVQELTLWLCARGFDGKQMERNVVGTVWFDDVALRERGTSRAELLKRGAVLPAPARPTPDDSPYRILSLDLGERLWGANELRLRVDNPSGKPFTFQPSFVLLSPSGQKLAAKFEEGAKAVKLAKEPMEITIPYRLNELARGAGGSPAASDVQAGRPHHELWTQHYRFETPWPISFSLRSPITLRLAGSYVYPDEKLEVGVNLNIAQASLKEVARCRLTVLHPGGEKVLLETEDVSKTFWTPDQVQPRILKDGHVDAKNLIVAEVAATALGLPVHPHGLPVRDCRIQATLLDRQGKVIAAELSDPFGFLEKPTSKTGELPVRIDKTEVSAGGTLLVNGTPYVFNCFPVAATDLGNVDRMLNFPKSHKLLALPYPKDLLFDPKDEEGWKQKVQDFVRANKNDAKLFGYYFAHDGETTFWFKRWKEMAGCQRKVAGWVREIDPNHVILSASWLFGHGALTPEAAAHFSFLDVIDVEPGLTWTPDSHAVRRSCASVDGGRPVAIVAGLECYYFQSANLLRWRVYEALRQGANGIGICPSGMLAAKPEIVSFLRGLHGEVEGLQPLITGQVPAAATKVDCPEVTLWERQHGKTRYLVAMTGNVPVSANNGRVTFQLPMKARTVQVMFEGRTAAPLQDDGGGGQFSDVFAGPHTVHVYRLEP